MVTCPGIQGVDPHGRLAFLNGLGKKPTCVVMRLIQAEFERRDLGEEIRASRARRLLRRRAKPTSILLDNGLVKKLREKGAKRGLGYQTMHKLIMREHLDDY
jgi:hypothetical protein